MATVQSLPLESVFPNPKQPRKQFDQASLEELAGSILRNGLAQPIKVTPRDGRFMIVMGERRWRAHVLAGMLTIDAIVADLTDAQIVELAMIENLNREDMDPMETAYGFQDMIDIGHSIAEIAEICGYKDDSEVKDHLALMKLSSHIQTAVREKRISFSYARQLAFLEQPNQDRLFKDYVGGRFPTLSKLKARVVAAYDAERQTSFFNDGSQLNQTEKRALSRVDVFLEGADKLLAGMTDEDFHIIRMTAKSDAPRCIEKITLLEAYCGRLRRALESSIARAEERREAA